MNPLHAYVAEQLRQKLESRGIVVFYDVRSEFEGFLAELKPTGDGGGSGIAQVRVAGLPVSLARFRGSFYETRHVVEPLVAGDSPLKLLVYVAGVERDNLGSPLKELECAGESYEPQLRRLARNALRNHGLSDGQIDALLNRENLTYQDIAGALASSDSSGLPSFLRSIFHDCRGSDALLVRWLADAARDGEIEARDCREELRLLIVHRLRFKPPADAPVAKMRAIVARYLLCGEFRADLTCEPPAALASVATPVSDDAVGPIRELAQRLRAEHPNAYAVLADSVEEELGLANAEVAAAALGAIDTFRFEERALLDACGELIAGGQFAEAQALVAGRERCFWLDRDVARRAQWESCRLMAELGETARGVARDVAGIRGDADAWVAAYTAPNGWARLDRAQRRLETLLRTLDEEPAELPLARVRAAYDEACQAMAEGFARALAAAGWSPQRTLHQTRVYEEAVGSRPRPVAYLLVDAMRYEMAAELVERLPREAETSLRPALAALPSITTVGMAALMPGADGSFSVVASEGELAAKVDGAVLPDLTARRKHMAARVPKSCDLTLDDLLGLSRAKLQAKIAKAELVVVRSQEIDHAGEAGFAHHARQAMDTVIDNLGRAVRKLAAAGVGQAVITADHGHLFHAGDQPESMRIDAPGGDTVELHRRAWIGRGGSQPGGSARVSASALGYASDLDFVFPGGLAVFRSGGDLAFHHGGTTLQEMVIPVLTVRMPAAVAAGATANLPRVRVEGVPAAVTNRIFIVTLELEASLFTEPLTVQPVLIHDGRQVGSLMIAHDAAYDPASHCVKLTPGARATIGFMLSDDRATAVRIVVLDPATDAELARSTTEIPVRLAY